MGDAVAMDSGSVDPRWENRQYLLKVIMEQCGITEEDMSNTSLVRAKVREAKIEKIIG